MDIVDTLAIVRGVGTGTSISTGVITRTLLELFEVVSEVISDKRFMIKTF